MLHKLNVRQLKNIISSVIKEVYQSHTFEPVPGDGIENVNPGCIHFGSQGIVLAVVDLPHGSGKTVKYRCTNSGDEWSSGDVLEKTLDQLEPM